MAQHCNNAMKAAKFLEDHDKVERIFYPGLEETEAVIEDIDNNLSKI